MRQVFEIRGIVQGVGFRPALFRLAERLGVRGSAQNRSGSVRLVLEGDPCRIEAFLRELPRSVPPAARIDAIVPVERGVDADPDGGFRIAASEADGAPDVSIPPDLAVCRACREEIFDPRGRRHGYAFTTCTECGPRYTVIHAMPYDRERTTMSAFPLCPACGAEYRDPADRRLHAESIACPSCGPRLKLLDAAGGIVPGDPLSGARRALADGRIIAVRGLGGYLLAVDAFRRDSLAELRRRKNRPHKPLAVMARDRNELERYCDVPAGAVFLLESAIAPIVIFDLRAGCEATGLPVELLSPDSRTLGAMLPTTPLHHLLLVPLPGDPVPPFGLLVMTSGNRRGEPICLSNVEALERLEGVADFFLCHAREIVLRADDSLCAMRRGGPQVWRRARGYAPNAVRLGRAMDACVLAMGAELKNAVAVGYGDRVVLSPHVGDLDTPEARRGLEQVARALPAFLSRRVERVAVDLHPDMASGRLGRRLALEWGVPVHAVQHHHAHAAACLAEHGRREGLALAFDGTGLGPDGTLWGAELLALSESGFQRLATFAAVPLPGGDEAVRRPMRQAVARLAAAGVAPDAEWLRRRGVGEDECAVWRRQCDRGPNAPATHSAGRLFDAFAAILGIAPDVATYDGQSAVRLEAAARGFRGPAPVLPVRWIERDGLLLADWSDAAAAAYDAALRGADAGAWAMGVHEAVACAAERMVAHGFGRTGLRTVALSGGVFMNAILTDRVVTRLEGLGAEVLLHRAVPPNDGGIAFGQAVVAGMAGRG